MKFLSTLNFLDILRNLWTLHIWSTFNKYFENFKEHHWMAISDFLICKQVITVTADSITLSINDLVQEKRPSNFAFSAVFWYSYPVHETRWIFSARLVYFPVHNSVCDVMEKLCDSTGFFHTKLIQECYSITEFVKIFVFAYMCFGKLP